MKKRAAVESIRMIGDITGNGITTKWDVNGTDLGIPVYSPSTQRMYFLFGDTFGVPTPEEASALPQTEYANTSRNWRGTIAGYTSDFDVSKGVNWEGFCADQDGAARALIDAHYTKNTEEIEVTKISQGGVEVDGALYVFYESIRRWGETGDGVWHINYTGAIKSTDGGATFSRVNDLSWVESDEGQYAPLIKRLVEENMDKQPSGVDFDLSSHVAPSFGQVFALDGKDGYIYVYGRHGGRKKGIKVGRVKKENIEVFAEYEYLTGFEGDKAIWEQGEKGLRTLLAKGEQCDIIPAPTSNMAVSYNSYLGKWLLTYFKPAVGILFALSETPYGPYTAPEMMLPIDHEILVRDNPTGNNRLYGGFTHELLNAEQGKKLRLVVSQWYKKYYNSRIVEIVFA